MRSLIDIAAIYSGMHGSTYLYEHATPSFRQIRASADRRICSQRREGETHARRDELGK